MVKHESLVPVVLLASSSLYLGFYRGYCLSKIFYNFSRTNFIKFRKIISFKKIIKIFWKRIKLWLIDIFQKFFIVMKANNGLIEAVRVLGKKWNLSLKLKDRFQLVKSLLKILEQTVLVYFALIDAFLFGKNRVNWTIFQINLIIQLSEWLTTKSIFLILFLYGLFCILLAIFGVLIGFLFGLYNLYVCNQEDCQLILFFLLKILYSALYEEFYYVLLETLRIRSLKISGPEKFSNFSLKTIPQIDLRPLKIMFMETDTNVKIPWPLFTESLGNIKIDFMLEEATNYKFELFKFYKKQKKIIF